jgi:hypothetical protein
MAYRAIFGVPVHVDDQMLVARLNGILEPYSMALDHGVQRRVCNPVFQASGLLSAFAGTMPAFCFDDKISDADQHDQCVTARPCSVIAVAANYYR